MHVAVVVERRSTLCHELTANRTRTIGDSPWLAHAARPPGREPEAWLTD